MNESYVFYASFDEAIRELPDKSRLRVYDAVSDYALRGIEPDFNGMEKAIFILIKTQIDRRNKRVEIGRKGGKKSQANSNHTSSKPQVNPELTPSYLEVNSATKEEAFPKEKERTKEKDITLEEENILERKKENKRDISTTGAHACEKIPDFSKMTDEELISWGETNPIDFENENSCLICSSWQEEMAKRATLDKKWSGKIVSGERLKSHEEIMTEFGLSEVVREELKTFLRNCYVNHHLVTNEKLTDIIMRLDDMDDESKCKCIRRAISGNYFDIKAGG